MSTILKALKKLEREKEALQATSPIPVVSTPSPARSGLSGWLLKPWLLGGLAGLIIVLLGGTTWYFYHQSRAYSPRLAERSGTLNHPPARRPEDAPKPAVSPPERKAAIPEPRRPDRSSHPEPQPVVRRPAARQTHRAEISDPGRSESMVEPSVSRTSGPPPAQENPAVVQPKPGINPARHPDTTIQRPSHERNATAELPAALEESEIVEAAPTGSPAQPDAASKSNAPADVYRNTPLLTDGRLRIHAIAWAPQPEERMAVINSRVLHEGDSVEDFVVMVIRPDDVVVREKGKSVWRIEFGRP